jgi:Tol biopolymer transport system component
MKLYPDPMRLKKIKYLLITLTLLANSFLVSCQFYNGLQMTFGKNRVQYQDFYWSFYRFERFDTYFNAYGLPLADYTQEIASKELTRLEQFFDYKLEKRIIFIIYNKLSDFRQSNIGLISGNDEYNTGGVTKIVDNKVFLFFDGNHQKFSQQISAAIAEVLINEMLYGDNLRENITNSTLINLPEWFIKGLISYVSVNWDFEIENKVKDAIINGKYDKFNRLTGEDAVYAGHSFWRFIAKTYGESIISNVIYITKINKNSNSGFLYVLGSNVKELSDEWLGFYYNQYMDSESKETFANKEKVVKRPKLKRVYQQVKYSPDGNYIAYSTNEFGQYKIWLYNNKTGKVKRLLKKEHKLDQIQDYSYPVLAWHPSSRILTFVTEEEGGLKLYYYTLDTKLLERRNIQYFEKILDYGFSQDGLKLAISGVKEGKTDLFVHTLSSSTDEQITNDLEDDLHPRFVNNSQSIIFSSNRRSDTIYSVDSPDNISLSWDLFVYNYASKSKVLTRLTNQPYVNNYHPLELERNQYAYLSDANGVSNRYVAKFDSTISIVDTAVHYRFFTNIFPETNYPRNILDHDISPSHNLGEVIFNKGRYPIFKENWEPKTNVSLNPLPLTEFRKNQTKLLQKNDSISRLKKKVITLSEYQSKPHLLFSSKDSLGVGNDFVDINNYVFEKEKINYYNSKLTDQQIKLEKDTTDSVKPKVRIYQPSFYTNYLVSQVDFSFLNASYQAFNGGAVYYNPGLNLLFKIGTNDLFEDYKIIGGVRFSGNFDSNEYLLSFENLKKRLDKQIVFHRQVYKSQTDYSLLKTYTHELMYVVKYPFNQVASIRGTVTYRNDNTVFLSTDLQNLNAASINKSWGGGKMEYIFDNTRNLGTNLYTGTRYKVFWEAYWQINDNFRDLYVFGVDFRHYERIHRTLIWASRFAASTSQGHSRLIYYLGSLDNWWTNLSKVQPFDNSVAINNRGNYAYQTLATNMRGFVQNIRNGNNFALINNELRWPMFRYFANRPISSSLINNFQIIGFCDIGTAWSGPNPWAGKNAYDKETINNYPLKVELETGRDPIVAGFGWGLRTQLFGYFIRLDWARGIENSTILPTIFYFSLSLDF